MLFVSVGVSECQSEDSFVCFGAKPTQRACTQYFAWDWKKMREGKVPGQWTEGSQQERAEGWLLGDKLGPVDPEAGLANARGCVSVPGGCVVILLGYTLVIVHSKHHKSVTNFSLLALGDNPSPCLFVLFFHLSIVYVVSCVFVKKCEISLTGDERNH